VAPYYIIGVHPDVCGQTLTPGDTINVAWSLSNYNDVSQYDGCYLAVRSTLVPDDANAYVTDKHVNCVAGGTSLVIPDVAHDTNLRYNGSLFTVRMNSDNYGDMVEPCTFNIQHEGWKPPTSLTDRLSIAGTVLSVLAIVATIVLWVLERTVFHD
jgi:hypothetical protein